MDKDSTILKYEQLEADNVGSEIDNLKTSNDEQEDSLAKMQEQLAALYKKTGKTQIVIAPSQTNEAEDKPVPEDTASEVNYDELYATACISLAERGLDVDSISFNDLLDDKELEETLAELNAPLPREDKWKKSDFIVVFIAASVGSVADIILGSRDKNSELSKELAKLHKHDSGAPIDFQGVAEGTSISGDTHIFSFDERGRGFHRELSKGHDLARFIEGIRMFKEGKFEAIAYKDKMAYTVIRAFNQNGKPYETLSALEATIKYAKHMLADVCSKNSLPFPGYSFLRESDSHRIRKLSADMYQNGFNIKNVILQSISTIIIEIIIRLYFSIQSVKKYVAEVEIKEDYSNFEAIKRFIKPINKDKLHEMLLVAHSIVMAVNVGKVVIKKSPWEINVTEITSVVNYGIKVTKAVAARNSDYAKLMYHSGEINKTWSELEDTVLNDELAVISEMPECLVI